MEQRERPAWAEVLEDPEVVRYLGVLRERRQVALDRLRTLARTEPLEAVRAAEAMVRVYEEILRDFEPGESHES